MSAVFINLHFRILSQPNISIAEMVRCMQAVYAPHDIVIRELSRDTLVLPEADSLEVGVSAADLTAEQQLLFNHRDGIGDRDICVYFVSEIKVVVGSFVQPITGSSSHPAGKPAAVVAKDALKWTLAHELGHVLGLTHEDSDVQRLMFESGDMSFPNPVPYLVWSELELIHQHPTLVHSQ